MSDPTKDVFVSGVPVGLVKALDEVAKREGCSRAALLIEGARTVLDRRSARTVYKIRREEDGSWSVGYEERGAWTTVARGMEKKDAAYVAEALGSRT